MPSTSLGYRHNVTASALRRADGLSASIGVIVEDVANPFFSCVQRGIEEVARERGVLTFAGSSDEQAERERAARRGVRRARRRRAHHRARERRSQLPAARPRGRRRARLRRPARALHRRRRGADRQRRRRRRCGRSPRRAPATGGSASSATGPTSTRRPSGCGASRRRSRATALRADRVARAPHADARGRRLRDDARAAARTTTPPTAVFTSQNLITIDAVRALHDLGLAALGRARRLRRRGARRRRRAGADGPRAGPGRARPRGGRAAVLAPRRRDGPSQQVVLAPTLIARGSGELPARWRVGR